MTPARKKLVALTAFNLCGMIVCQVFVLRHTPHSYAFQLAFYGFLLFNAWLSLHYNSKRRQPDTLIHLFPPPPEISEERS